MGPFRIGQWRKLWTYEFASEQHRENFVSMEILVGHWVSEDQGMRLCADWLKSFIAEVPVEWIPAGDPFWRP